MTTLLQMESGGRRLFARATQVHRIGPPRDEAIASPLLGAAGSRGLDVLVDGALHSLAVERICGVVECEESTIHPLPRIARECLGTAALVELVESDDELCPLLDLEALVRERLQDKESPDGG